MGRPHIARGPAADDDTRAWEYRVSIKGMSPAPGIKFSRGPLQWHFYFNGTLLLKIVALKQLIGKFLNRSAVHILDPRPQPPICFFDTLFS
jgi:hypothetical protein